MEGKNFVPNTTSADLMQSWHIPRPTLARSSKSSTTSGSTNSTQSARSGSLLLTAANLAQITHATTTKEATATAVDSMVVAAPTSPRDENIRYFLESSTNHPLTNLTCNDPKKCQSPNEQDDNLSIASSMHFTVVNVSRTPAKTRSFCKKHQLTVLVLTMSAIFTIGIITAIFLLEMRARRQPPN